LRKTASKRKRRGIAAQLLRNGRRRRRVAALGMSDEEYNDPCCGCGCEDDTEREECFERLIMEEEQDE
jgi:hypothetical protein